MMSVKFEFLSYKEPFELNDKRVGLVFRTKLIFKGQKFIISESHWTSLKQDGIENYSYNLTDVFTSDDDFNNLWSEVISGATSTEEALIFLEDYLKFLGEQG